METVVSIAEDRVSEDVAFMVDYDAIFKTLIECSNKRSLCLKPAFPLHDSVGLRHWLREVRTVGIDVARQVGKTTWVRKRLLEDPDSCVIVINTNAAKEYLMALGPQIKDRVFTAKEVALAMRQGNAPKWSTYYLDEATYIYDNLASSTFYKWVALANNPDAMVLTIS